MATFKIRERDVFLHLSEGAHATYHHTDYDIINQLTGKVVRYAHAPNLVDAELAKLEQMAKDRGLVSSL